MRKRRRWLPVLAVLCAGAFLISVLLRTRVNPLMEKLALAAVDDAASNLINDAVDRLIANGEIRYDNLVTLVQNENGAILALTIDMQEMNRLKTELLKLLDQEVSRIDQDRISVTLGNLSGIELLSGRGPEIPMKVVFISTSDASFDGIFYAAGINQTIHRIILHVSLELLILLPSGTIADHVTSDICVAETVLLGQVPESYTYWGGEAENDPMYTR